MARKTLRNKKDEAKVRKLMQTFNNAKGAAEAAGAKAQALVEAMPEAKAAQELQQKAQEIHNALMGACIFAFNLDADTKFGVAVDESDRVYVEVHDEA